jgi:hypothetical protein
VCSQEKGVKSRVTERRSRSGVNWKRGVKQKSLKKTGVKRVILRQIWLHYPPTVTQRKFVHLCAVNELLRRIFWVQGFTQ